MSKINIVNGKEYSVYIDGTNDVLFTGCAQNATDIKDTFIKKQEEKKDRLNTQLKEEEENLEEAEALLVKYEKEFKKTIVVEEKETKKSRTFIGRLVENITETKYEVPKYVKDERVYYYKENDCKRESQIYIDQYIKEQDLEYNVEQHLLMKLDYTPYWGNMLTGDMSINLIIEEIKESIKRIEDILSSKLIVVEKRNIIKAPTYELLLQEKEEE